MQFPSIGHIFYAICSACQKLIVRVAAVIAIVVFVLNVTVHDKISYLSFSIVKPNTERNYDVESVVSALFTGLFIVSSVNHGLNTFIYI